MALKSKKRQESGSKSGAFEQNPAETSKTGLFDLSKPSKAFDPGAPIDEGKFLEQMTLAELLELRGQIEDRLPARKLSELNLEEEVLLQFARTRELYNRIADNNQVPANQRAQVANSCTTILDQLIKMQVRLYGAERVKALEGALIRTLREFPEDVQSRFFELYERALESAALPAPTARVPA